jgi:carbamoyltransferase
MLYRVLTEFKRLSGFGVVINTSFNLHGRTIVNTPDDALDDFLESQMDFLVLDGYLVRRLSRDTQELAEGTSVAGQHSRPAKAS